MSMPLPVHSLLALLMEQPPVMPLDRLPLALTITTSMLPLLESGLPKDLFVLHTILPWSLKLELSGLFNQASSAPEPTPIKRFTAQLVPPPEVLLVPPKFGSSLTHFPPLLIFHGQPSPVEPGFT